MQKITLVNAGCGSKAVPVKVGADTVPAGVKLAVLLVGTEAGQAIVPAGVKLWE